jgi:5-enolpyruvylshikimate-3-phosphate synthase
MVWTSRPVSRLHGILRAPGDKSCSHRALIMGGIADGTSYFTGLLEGDDVLRTGAANGKSPVLARAASPPPQLRSISAIPAPARA